MKYLPVATILLGGALPSMADYVVDIDLGVLPLGDTPLAGTTALTQIDPGPPAVFVGGNNNSIFPKNIFADGANLNWGNEIVYQFEVLQPAIISLTSNTITGDPDFFLLDGLTTSVDLQSGKISADNALGAVLLDFTPPETEEYAAVLPGVYFIAVEAYIGPDGNVTPSDADFDVTLNVRGATAFDFPLELGHIAREGTPFSLDTFGSLFDTELAVYDIFGARVAENNDAGGGLQSEIFFDTGLFAGGYYAVVAGFDTTFDPAAFVLSPGGAVGDWFFNFPLGPTFGPGLETGATDASNGATEAQVFFFSIGAAPINTTDLGMLANADVPFVINTNGSLFDTQLGLFDGEGFLTAFNDDIDLAGGNFLSEINLDVGLPAGEYFLALAGYPNFFGDGFFVTVDTRIAAASEGGDFRVNHPVGAFPPPLDPLANLPQSSQEWFTFTIGSSTPAGIQVTDVDFNPATNEFTLSWDSSLPGPFNVFVGTPADLAALGAPPANVLPTLGAPSVTSPHTFTVPVPLQGEPALFLQVTD